MSEAIENDKALCRTRKIASHRERADALFMGSSGQTLAPIDRTMRLAEADRNFRNEIYVEMERTLARLARRYVKRARDLERKAAKGAR